MDEFTKQLQDICISHANTLKAGIAHGQRDGQAAEAALRLIVETAKRYPNALLPTPLLCAILAGEKAL